MNFRPHIAVLTLNWNSEDYTNRLIDSLIKTNYPNLIIVVVDNGSSIDSFSKLKKTEKNIHILRSEINLGYSGGNNLGLTFLLKFEIDYVLIINNDTFVDVNIFESICYYLKELPESSFLTGKILQAKFPEIIQSAGSKLNLWSVKTTWFGNNKQDTNQYNELKKINNISGCLIVCRLKDIIEVGLFDEIFFCYWEDTDLSARLNKLNYQIFYVPFIKIWHFGGVSTKINTLLNSKGSMSPFHHYYSIRNRIILARKHCSLIQKLIFIPKIFLSEFLGMLLILLLLGRYDKLMSRYKGLIDGFKTKIS